MTTTRFPPTVTPPADTVESVGLNSRLASLNGRRMGTV